MPLDTLIEQAFAPAAASVREGNIPGAVLGIVTADGTRAVQWAGHAQIEPEPQAVQRELVAGGESDGFDATFAADHDEFALLGSQRAA